MGILLSFISFYVLVYSSNIYHREDLISSLAIISPTADKMLTNSREELLKYQGCEQRTNDIDWRHANAVLHPTDFDWR